jgi:mRNA-degrading endonuclease RelE of RelBE toxin-antitoxin system
MEPSPIEYQPTSPVLFLGICSLNKATSSNDEPYKREQSIAAWLKDSQAVNLLYQTRKSSLELTLQGNLENKGSLLAQHPLNRDLRRGPDFNGTARAKYLPAIDRYIGRFYGGLGHNGKVYALKTSLNRSPHHLLIISGLYGLLLPQEQIQLYESPLEDLLEIQTIWKENNRLTRLLSAYIKARGIRLVVDMTGQRAYHEMIDWPAIYALPGVRVLHAMANIGPGEDQIKTFGAALCDPLLHMPASELLALPDSWVLETHHLILRSIPSPPKGENWPREPGELEIALAAMRQGLEIFSKTVDEDYEKLFGHDKARVLIEKIRQHESPWSVAINPKLIRDIDQFDDPNTKRNLFTDLVSLLTIFPVSRKNKAIRELSNRRLGEYLGWRIRIGKYRLIFFTDERSRQLYLHSFDKKHEDEETYDISSLPARKIRAFFLRIEE